MKKLSRIAAFVCCAALTLLADDFWLKKPYTEWVEKDAFRLLHNSPWAHQTSINLGDNGRSSEGGGGGGRRGRGGDGMGEAAPGAMENPNMNGPNGGSRGGRGSNSIDSLGGGASILVTVCWQSALPVRQASIVTKLGHEKAASDQAVKFLNQEVPGYVVSVLGLPGAMGRMPPERLNELAKTATVLRIKDKDPIPAAKAQAIPRDEVLDLYFVFSKSSPITLDDKEVEFSVTFGRTEVKRKFKLKDMVVGDKLEL